MVESVHQWFSDLNEMYRSATLRFVIHDLSRPDLGAEAQGEHAMHVVSAVSRATQVL
jgi:hypothetical protein